MLITVVGFSYAGDTILRTRHRENTRPVSDNQRPFFPAIFRFSGRSRSIGGSSSGAGAWIIAGANCSSFTFVRSPVTGDYRSRLKIESTADWLSFLINDLSHSIRIPKMKRNFRLHAEEGEETFDVLRSALRNIYAPRNSRNERVEISGSK